MYNLKRILTELSQCSSVVGATANIPLIRSSVTLALEEVERLEREATDTPQEIRDLFAAAGLMGIMADPGVKLDRDHQYIAIADQAWSLSDHMMLERAKRIASRQQPQGEPKDSIGE